MATWIIANPLVIKVLLVGVQAASAQNGSIGTSTPNQKLEVVGKLRLSAAGIPATVYSLSTAAGLANLLAVACEQLGGTATDAVPTFSVFTP